MSILQKIIRKVFFGVINTVLKGTHFFGLKRFLLNQCQGIEIGYGSKIVAPLFVTGSVVIGENCWIGHDFSVEGNGKVIIGDNCDIAPFVHCFTGTHEIDSTELKRAGTGYNTTVRIGTGCWIGGNAVVLPSVTIGSGTVIGCGSVVNKSVPENVLAAGNPVIIKRSISVCNE